MSYLTLKLDDRYMLMLKPCQISAFFGFTAQVYSSCCDDKKFKRI